MDPKTRQLLYDRLNARLKKHLLRVVDTTVPGDEGMSITVRFLDDITGSLFLPAGDASTGAAFADLLDAVADQAVRGLLDGFAEGFPEE